jgi:hypothetical protein
MYRGVNVRQMRFATCWAVDHYDGLHTDLTCMDTFKIGVTRYLSCAVGTTNNCNTISSFLLYSRS